MQPGLRAVGIREIQKSLEQSVKRLLEDKIDLLGLSSYFDPQKFEIKTPGGGIIIFQGMQNHTAESIKSLEGYDIAWVEEAQSLSQRSLDLLRPTLRKPNSEIWFSWNPRSERDPVDDFLRCNSQQSKQKKVAPPKNAIVVEANWQQNPWFTAELKEERDYDLYRDPDKYAHIWGGNYLRNTEATVFRNWRADEFETPDNATFYQGADWGYAVDPTVLVRCYIEGRTLYVDQEVYKVNCEIDKTPALFDTLVRNDRGEPVKEQQGIARKWPIKADSARPETISYMARNGYPKIKPALKGPNSVMDGIEFLKSYDIVVHPRCRHTIDELTLYSFKTDPLTGDVLPVLEDKKNHVIDALRYAVEGIRRQPAKPLFGTYGTRV